MREIHVAGPLVDYLQYCTRCGEILTDYRNTVVPADQPPLTGWAVGAHVEIDRWPGFTSTVVTNDAPTCEEIPPDSIEGHGLL